jgi:hypothetical protein
MRYHAFWSTIAIMLGAVHGAAAAPDACADVLKVLHSTATELKGGGAVFRQLPILIPGRRRVLALNMTIARRDGIFIGPYQVDGVPVLDITPSPKNGTSAYIINPTTRKKVSVPPECLARPELVYGGTLWQLAQGDHIATTLTSQLDFNSMTSTRLRTAVFHVTPAINMCTGCWFRLPKEMRHTAEATAIIFST